SLKDREGSRCGASSRAAARRRSRSSALRAASRIPRPSPTSTSRSEEHTSELQSRFDLVCRLLLEEKNWISATYATAMLRASSCSSSSAAFPRAAVRSFLSYRHGAPLDLHSFPTRRSSDLVTQGQGGVTVRRELEGGGEASLTVFGITRRLKNPTTFAYIDLKIGRAHV